MSYYSTPIRMATIKKQQKISVDRNVKKKKNGTLVHSW